MRLIVTVIVLAEHHHYHHLVHGRVCNEVYSKSDQLLLLGCGDSYTNDNRKACPHLIVWVCGGAWVGGVLVRVCVGWFVQYNGHK